MHYDPERNISDPEAALNGHVKARMRTLNEGCYQLSPPTTVERLSLNLERAFVLALNAAAL